MTKEIYQATLKSCYSKLNAKEKRLFNQNSKEFYQIKNEIENKRKKRKKSFNKLTKINGKRINTKFDKITVENNNDILNYYSYNYDKLGCFLYFNLRGYKNYLNLYVHNNLHIKPIITKKQFFDSYSKGFKTYKNIFSVIIPKLTKVEIQNDYKKCFIYVYKKKYEIKIKHNSFYLIEV